MPKSRNVDGVEVNYDSYDDDDDHEDEKINESLLLDPEEFLLVDRYDRAIILPYSDREFQPQNPATKAINHAIKSKYQYPYQDWSEVKKDEAGLNQFWNGFREKVTWHKDYTDKIKAVFNGKAAKRLSSLLSEARKRIKEDPSKIPKWIDGKVPELKNKWAKPEYQKRCAQASQNRNSDNGGCIHSGGSTSAATARIRFIKEHGRAPTLVEMNDIMHKYNDGTWIENGLKAQEVASLTTIFTEEYDAEQNSLPVHLRDSPEIRQMRISHSFVKYAGGKHRGRAFAAGSTSSFYQMDPSGLRDTGDTSYGSHISTRRSQAPQETQAAILRAQIREEVRDELRQEMEQGIDQRVQQLFKAQWDAAVAKMTQVAQQRSFTAQNDNTRRSLSSQSQQSNHRNHPSSSQGYRPDLCNLPRNNIDLNRGLSEYRENDLIMNLIVDDYGDFFLDDVELYVQIFNPTMQASGSGGRGAGNDNINQNFPNRQGNPNQSGRGHTGRERRPTLPPLTINEGGRGRSTTRNAGNVSRGRGGNNRGKQVLVEPEPEPEEDNDYDE